MNDFTNKVLIIDDNIAYHRLIVETIKDNSETGIIRHILFADTAKKGLELYVTYRPMMVLLDVKMPGKSGSDAAKMIHNYDNSANIMFVTNYPDDPDVAEAISSRLASGSIDKGLGVGVLAGIVAFILKAISKAV